jgi:N-acyl-phosphatidylethanolamine-hydrolysing phospholipase D
MEKLMPDNDTSHYDDNGFKNPYMDEQQHGFRALFKWIFTRKPDIPDEYSMPVIENPTQFFSNHEDVLICWIGHATFLIRIHGTWIITDPFFSERASPLQRLGPKRMVPPAIPLHNLPPVDYVLISHSHYDHLDKPVVRQLADRGSKFLVPLRLESWFENLNIPVAASCDWYGQFETSSLKFTATPAQHFSARTPFDRNKTLWCGWMIEKGDMRIYFAGDTGYFPGFKQIGKQFSPIHIALLPIGAYEPRWFMKSVHMNPADAVEAYKDLGAQSALGMHFGTIKLTDEAMDEPPAQLESKLFQNEISLQSFRSPAFGETFYWSGGGLKSLSQDVKVFKQFHLP